MNVVICYHVIFIGENECSFMLSCNMVYMTVVVCYHVIFIGVYECSCMLCDMYWCI